MFMVTTISIIVICIVLAGISRRYYTSNRNYRTKVISKEGVRAMRTEQWHEAVIPVYIVEHPYELPPEQ